MEQSNTLESANEQDNKNYFNREEIQNTPFAIVTQNDKIYITIAGKAIKEIPKELIRKEVEEITKINWELIIPVMGIMIEKIKE